MYDKLIDGVEKALKFQLTQVDEDSCESEYDSIEWFLYLFMLYVVNTNLIQNKSLLNILQRVPSCHSLYFDWFDT